VEKIGVKIMAEIEQTRVCPHCAETIKAAAKVCPHCRFWQPKTKWSLRNPQFLQSVSSVICAAAIFGAIIGLVYFLQHLIGPKRDFTPYQSQIKVVSSEASFRVVFSNLTVSVVGVVTNQSDFSWKQVALEAQLFGTDDKLIDVIQADGDYRGIVVLPHTEAGFKIEGKAIKKESEYASHQVFVRTAKDIRAWP
jgi:uncharacterized ubiquitin-like protein YukD